ncbi:hypothetical protein E4U21_005156 [Claviceps maximensis]|nr:hypothetical protein E4U21_005156 [Claviceps maximensis]
MSLRGLEERLTALQETTTQLRELIDRLAKLEFQPGAVPLDTDDESSVSGELSAEIGQVLRNGLDEHELLTEEVKFVRPEGGETARLREGIERLGAELVSCRGQFRNARLSARQSLAQARKLERRLLIQSYLSPVTEPASPGDGASEEASASAIRSQRHHTTYQTRQHINRQSNLSAEDQQAVGASNNVTSALRRTHDLIAAELFRSEYAHQTLTESSAALRELDESYSSLDSMLASSRDLLGTLLRSQKSDTWYLQTALYMLMVTGAWLLFRRILYGPMWWLVWLPLRVLFGVGSRAGSAVMMHHHRSAPGESSDHAVAGVVIDGGRVSVDGLPGEDLPTAQVGGHEGRDSASKAEDTDSVMDKIAEIVDAVNEADELGNLDDVTDGKAEPADQARNTKKRMWEEPEVIEEIQQRDEL